MPEVETARADLIPVGRRVYAEHCAACHGADGGGQANWRQRKPDGKLPAPPLNGSGHTWHHPDQQLFRMIEAGVAAVAPEGYKTDMAGFGDRLSDREIVAVMTYVKTWWPERARKEQRARTERASNGIQ